MNAYIDTYREWKMLTAHIKNVQHKVTPEKFQELKKRQRELLAKLDKML